MSAVDEAYGRVFGPVAKEVMAPEKLAVPNEAPPTALNWPATVEDEVTVRSVVEAEIAEISENLLVEEAKIPLVALMMEEVAAVI